MTNPSRIIGAGLSGLIAAHAWPNVPIIEASPEPEPHRALLRFRSDNVAKLTGIEFKKVLVRKGLWSRGEFKAPTIALANTYSLKVLGRILGDRSVWNLEAAERFIAPEDFQERLLDNVRARVTFNTTDGFEWNLPIISTAPMPVALNALGIKHTVAFNRSAINVQRYRVPRCEAHQTVYFPDLSTGVYRASITGSMLIVESIAGQTPPDEHLAALLAGAFGIRLGDCESLGGTYRQQYGKIVSLPDAQRRGLMYKLTSEHGIYSLGRFAQWRNILLDDVVNDIHVIKKLLATDNYALRKAAS